MLLCVESRGQLQGSFLKSTFSLLETGSLSDLGLSHQASLADQQVPGIHLASSPWSWVNNPVLPCPGLFTGTLGIRLKSPSFAAELPP